MKITREHVEVVLDALARSSHADNWQHCIEHPDLANSCIDAITEICNTPLTPSGPDFTDAQRARLSRSGGRTREQMDEGRCYAGS